MPDKKRPLNIFDVINQNIFAVSEDLHTLMTEFASVREDINQIRAMFNAPVVPNASGEASAEE